MKKIYNFLLMCLGLLIAMGGLVLGSWIYQYNIYLTYAVSLPLGGLGFMLFLINGFQLTRVMKKKSVEDIEEQKMGRFAWKQEMKKISKELEGDKKNGW